MHIQELLQASQRQTAKLKRQVHLQTMHIRDLTDDLETARSKLLMQVYTMHTPEDVCVLVHTPTTQSSYVQQLEMKMP